MHLKTCKHCGEVFRTVTKHGKFCEECNRIKHNIRLFNIRNGKKLVVDQEVIDDLQRRLKVRKLK